MDKIKINGVAIYGEVRICLGKRPYRIVVLNGQEKHC